MGRKSLGTDNLIDLIMHIFLGQEGFVEYQIKDTKATRISLVKVLMTLTPRESVVMILRYAAKLTLKEIGFQIGLTTERIRQIECRAFRKLRHPSRSKFIKDCLERRETKQ